MQEASKDITVFRIIVPQTPYKLRCRNLFGVQQFAEEAQSALEEKLITYKDFDYIRNMFQFFTNRNLNNYVLLAGGKLPEIVPRYLQELGVGSWTPSDSGFLSGVGFYYYCQVRILGSTGLPCQVFWGLSNVNFVESVALCYYIIVKICKKYLAKIYRRSELKFGIVFYIA
eukprot:TRINITY_DN23526_c1_g1_i2.p3 TRINITY_DN23526_c1_g1~~TRINITY_DN23526_c1_g1_i2.p3  ORF type:complete len:186 (-),score=15.72 TRINITY_DN23526_c1_g1_i2:469-981(-)